MEDVDHISALPDEVIHHILSFLKVKEAAPTMVLSKRWRYLWTFNPNLCFGGEYYGACDIAAIDGCVKKYQANQLQTFCIESMLWNVEVAQIQQWLDFAIEKKVNHLTFRGNWFTVPDSLFSSQRLQSLTLSNCHLHHPSDIKCFDSLKHLDLYNICDPDGAVQSLLSKCQRLQSLFLNTDPCPDPINACISLPDLRELNVCFRCSTFTICAPTLQNLEVHGDISGKLVVQSAPSVKRARFGFRDDFKSPLDIESWGFIIQSIANVETLLLSDQVLQLHTLYCSKGKRFTFKNLKVLHVHYLWSFPSLYPRLFSLFQDCPWLEEIHFDLMVTYGSAVNWEEMGLEGPPAYEDVDVDVSSDIHKYGFDHLKLVKMLHFSGCPKQMAVIKFLLEKATVLESVHIVFNREVKDEEEQLQYMSQLRTISPSVTIKRIEQEFSL